MGLTAVALDPPDNPDKDAVLSALAAVYTAELWAAVRVLCLKGEISRYEWRRLWRKHHPNGGCSHGEG